ncbi:MAG TPA: response regulator, partial [Polyangiaceae bacterium]|nr:response regulator [Polyangiaceae bacterium]
MVRQPSMPSETAPREDLPGLSNSRADFAASLQRRIETVLAALSEFEAQPASSDRRDNFLRRIHALRASAKVLGFAAASEVLSYAEQQIRTCSSESPADDIAAVKKQLESLPSLVLRGAYSVAPPGPPSARPKSIAPLLSEPLAVVVWATPDFVDTLRSIERTTTSLELSVVETPDELRSTCAAIGPDVLVLDANLGSITLWVDELAQAPETSAIPIVVANVPDAAAAGLQELGARLVLPIRTNEHQLSHALFQVRHPAPERNIAPAPLGDVTLKDLAERLAQEIRLGLVDSAPAAAQLESIPLAEGTAIRAALWAALAQIREQVADASAGRVQFVSGPEGSTPIAPRSAPSARPRTSASADAVDLTGRRMLVVDDDPAVAWFVGGTLRAAGALVTELHDGADALELAYRAWPELIVSDVLMPGLDGFALCHAIKRDVLLRDVPIVLLSWKEDLLFRLRELGADADGYLRKEANASTIVRRVRELLLPRSALERRLLVDRESRGRLDGMSTRLLLELAAALERPVRVALRDSTALYDIRIRHGTLAAVSRTRHDGTVDQGEAVLAPLLGVTAARFSVVTDREACEPMFFGALADILQPSALRTRAAQRVFSGTTLGTIDRVGIAPEAFGGELPPLPLSLRPIADELLRGASPRQLLATGVASTQLLESLLSDLARRGSIRSIEDVKGQDLLECEIQRLQAKPAMVPPKPASRPQPQFTFQLSPAPPDAVLLAGNAQVDADQPEHGESDIAATALARALQPTTSEGPSALEGVSNALAGLGYLSAPPAAESRNRLEPHESQQLQSAEADR